MAMMVGCEILIPDGGDIVFRSTEEARTSTDPANLFRAVSGCLRFRRHFLIMPPPGSTGPKSEFTKSTNCLSPETFRALIH
jgi:hypothetical protein